MRNLKEYGQTVKDLIKYIILIILQEYCMRFVIYLYKYIVHMCKMYMYLT